MADGPRPCPHCGSVNTKGFPDGSGLCGNCGRAFRGSAPTGVLLAGEEVVARGAARPREKVRIGVLGVLGGLLGFVAIPVVFLLGAALRRLPLSAYVSDVFNKPSGALTCGGVALLVVFAWYATWAGYHVWRGYPERKVHLVAAGALLTVAGVLAGQGLPGIVGIAGGLLALGTGLLVWRTGGTESEDRDSPTAPESS